jgi:predicted DNA-binding transcriptional regulator AlpA
MTHAKTPRPGETGPEAAGGYLRERELAERWKVSGRMLGRWRQTGDGPPFIRVGRRRILYRLADCEAWLAGRTHASRAAELALQEQASR